MISLFHFISGLPTNLKLDTFILFTVVIVFAIEMYQNPIGWHFFLIGLVFGGSFTRVTSSWKIVRNTKFPI